MVITKHSFLIMVVHTTITAIYIYIIVMKFLACICCYVLFTKIKKGYA